jgi:hypothetical protein
MKLAQVIYILIIILFSCATTNYNSDYLIKHPDLTYNEAKEIFGKPTEVQSDTSVIIATWDKRDIEQKRKYLKTGKGGKIVGINDRPNNTYPMKKEYEIWTTEIKGEKIIITFNKKSYFVLSFQFIILIIS